MSFTQKYIDYVNQSITSRPEQSWNKVMLGLQGHRLGKKMFPNKNLPVGYQKLEKVIHDFMTKGLAHPEKMVWANIFTPCEIFQAFGFRMISVEALASYLGSGFQVQDYFIDTAQSAGIAPTLCSYHKAFLGAALSHTVPSPVFSVTTSLSCDGNLNTFRAIEQEFNLPAVLLDIPYDSDQDSIEYLAEQLEDLVRQIEEVSGSALDIEKLKKILETENKTRVELKQLLAKMQKYQYPCEILDGMWLALAVHLMMGTEELYDVVHTMNQEIETYPEFKGKTILWVHLVPYYQQTIRSVFDFSDKYQLVGSDMLLDYQEELDVEKPFEALARKLIFNIFNGSYHRKSDQIIEMAKDWKVDGVIHFCHWGCKQACGGAVLLKNELSDSGIPMLILDGDGIDERNSHDGQIKTRVEAFLEMLEKQTC